MTERPTARAVLPQAYEAADQSLGELLRRWRESRGSVADCSRELGIGPGTLRRWEGGAAPSPRHVDRLAVVLGVPRDVVIRSLPPDLVHRPETTGLEGSTPLAQARARLGISQAELARRIPVAQSVVSRWECAERRPAHPFLHRIQEALLLSADEAVRLFAGYPDDRRSGAGKLPGLTAALASSGLSTSDLAKALDVHVPRARALAHGRAGLSWSEAQATALLLGREPTSSLDDLRRKPAASVEGMRGLRLSRGLTQVDVAGPLGVSASTVGNWERGRALPSSGQVRRLARVLAIAEAELADLLGVPLLDPQKIVEASDRLDGALGQLRSSAGLTKAQVARALGVQHASVSRWETAQGRPRRTHVRRLSLLYGVKPRGLLELAEASTRLNASLVTGRARLSGANARDYAAGGSPRHG